MSADAGAEAEVLAAVAAYDAALAGGDTAGAAGWFAAEHATRFGPQGPAWSVEEVRAVRAATAPLGAAEIVRQEARVLGDGLVLHLAVLRRSGADVQRTQVWRRTPAGWRIVHAHVS